MAAKLKLTKDDQTLEMPLQEVSYTFGTAPGNSVPVPSRFKLEDRHFAIETVPGQRHQLVPVSRKGTTEVNGVTVKTPRLLEHGDIIKAGGMVLEYHNPRPKERGSFRLGPAGISLAVLLGLSLMGLGAWQKYQEFTKSRPLAAPLARPDEPEAGLDSSLPPGQTAEVEEIRAGIDAASAISSETPAEAFESGADHPEEPGAERISESDQKLVAELVATLEEPYFHSLLNDRERRWHETYQKLQVEDYLVHGHRAPEWDRDALSAIILHSRLVVDMVRALARPGQNAFPRHLGAALAEGCRDPWVMTLAMIFEEMPGGYQLDFPGVKTGAAGHHQILDQLKEFPRTPYIATRLYLRVMNFLAGLSMVPLKDISYKRDIARVGAENLYHLNEWMRLGGEAVVQSRPELAGSVLEGEYYRNLSEYSEIICRLFVQPTNAIDYLEKNLTSNLKEKERRLVVGKFLLDTGYRIKRGRRLEALSEKEREAYQSAMDKAREALQEAWSEGIQTEVVAENMLVVLRGTGHRDELDEWLMKGLEHGSGLKGTVCEERRLGIPSLVYGGRPGDLTALLRRVQSLDLAAAKKLAWSMSISEREKLGTDAIWPNVAAVFDAWLRVHPEDYSGWSEYACASYMVGRDKASLQMVTQLQSDVIEFPLFCGNLPEWSKIMQYLNRP